MTYKPGQKIGYLGGGQLARLLSQSAQSLGLEALVFSVHNSDPAAQVVRHWHQGEISDSAKVVEFLNQISVATFESEFVDIPLLKIALAQTQCDIYPAPDVMAQIQDRKLQKKLFDDYRLPTSPWQDLPDQRSLENYAQENTFPFVLKKRFMGYDGYGTFMIHNPTELKNFIKNHWQENLYIAESFIPFKKECAIILARSLDGSLTHLPFVESHQKEARCDWVRGPLAVKKEKKWIKKLFHFLEQINYIGVMGVEFFLNKGELIINEIAPRVHNTGHYSIELEGFSQFDLHNMALLGQALPPPTKIRGGFAMVNLIGNGQALQIKACSGLHWYGKQENKIGRKMGHLTVTAATPQAALKKALKQRGELGL